LINPDAVAGLGIVQVLLADGPISGVTTQVIRIAGVVAIDRRTPPGVPETPDWLELRGRVGFCQL
jgi:hypothetical protein